MNFCKAAQHKRDRHTDTPDKYTVKQECDSGFSTGSQGKICGMTKGAKWHNQSRHNDKPGRQIFDFLLCIIDSRKKSSKDYHQECDNRTTADTKENHLIIETGADRNKMQITKWAIQTNNTANERLASERAAAKEAAEKAKAEKKEKKSKKSKED